MIRKEFLSILSNLELERKSRSFKVKAGNAESSKRGRGLDFKDVRLYDFGDDTRLIDWNVTSRFGELYVREFYEEKERQAIVFTIYLLLWNGAQENFLEQKMPFRF